MDRRKALATASAATLVAGSAVVAIASLTGMSLLGFGGHLAAVGGTTAAGARERVVVRTRNVYDRYVVVTTPATAAIAHASTVAYSTTDSNPPPEHGATGVPQTPSSTTPTTTRRGDTPRTTTSTSTSQTGPSTTVATTTTTIRPRGVPTNWPPDEPIPPVPPNCREQRLTLDGIWHCDD